MKKWFLFIVLLLFFMNFVLAQDILNDSFNKSAVEDIQNNVEKVKDIKEKVENFSSSAQNLTFLESSWRELLLKNKVIFSVDSFFNKISFLFLILFAGPYLMSFNLLGVMILWFFIFFNASKIIKSLGIVGKDIFPYLGGFIITIVLSWLNILNYITIFLSKLIFSPENWWLRLIFFALVLCIFFVVEYLSLLVSKFFKDRDKIMKEKATDLSQKAIQKFAEKMAKSQQK